MTPRNDESPAATGLPQTEHSWRGSRINLTPYSDRYQAWRDREREARRSYRRNGHKGQAASNAATLAALAPAGCGAGAGGPARERVARCGESLLVAPGSTAQSAWVAWLAPTFAGNDSCYFTGTYSDKYGVPNGLMLPRNVHKDFTRFLESFQFEGDFIIGVERHRYRDVLHLHAILEGPFTPAQMRWVKEWWQAQRGHARALPVLDGCESYVTKYALKGDTDSFEWRLS